MEIVKIVEGWNSSKATMTGHPPTFLAIVLFRILDHPRQLSAYVVIDKTTGKIHKDFPTRVADLDARDDIKPEPNVSPEVIAKIEAAAFKFAEKKCR